jgi:hypothetical protein
MVVPASWRPRPSCGCPPVLELPRGEQGQPLGLLDLDVRVGDSPLDRLVVGDRVAHRDAVLGVLDGHVEQALGAADRASRMR